MTPTKLSMFLKKTRSELNLTQKQLASALDISLDAVKKIESSNTQLPSTKVLNGLSKLTNIHQVDIIADILFDENEEIIYSLSTLIKNYLAYLYIKGYSISEFSKTRTIQHDGKIFEFSFPIVSKKTDSSYKIIIDSCENYFNLKDIMNEEIYKREKEFKIITDIYTHFLTIPTQFKEIHILFDSNNEKEMSLYLELMKYHTDLFNLSIFFVAYDKRYHNAVQTFKFS